MHLWQQCGTSLGASRPCGSSMQRSASLFLGGAASVCCMESHARDLMGSLVSVGYQRCGLGQSRGTLRWCPELPEQTRRPKRGPVGGSLGFGVGTWLRSSADGLRAWLPQKCAACFSLAVACARCKLWRNRLRCFAPASGRFFDIFDEPGPEHSQPQVPGPRLRPALLLRSGDGSLQSAPEFRQSSERRRRMSCVDCGVSMR